MPTYKRPWPREKKKSLTTPHIQISKNSRIPFLIVFLYLYILQSQGHSLFKRNKWITSSSLWALFSLTSRLCFERLKKKNDQFHGIQDLWSTILSHWPASYLYWTEVSIVTSMWSTCPSKHGYDTHLDGGPIFLNLFLGQHIQKGPQWNRGWTPTFHPISIFTSFIRTCVECGGSPMLSCVCQLTFRSHGCEWWNASWHAKMSLTFNKSI